MQSFRPQADGRYLARPRLLDRLPQEPGFVVWLEAPYGYGKSVLASQWTDELERAGWRSLWLAARRSGPRAQLAEAMGMPAASPWPTMRESLRREKTLVVVEDLESLEHHEELSPLLQEVSGLVLLASRGPLDAPELESAREAGRLVHLTSSELAFTEGEASELFGDDGRAHKMRDATNGWPLPVHFASLTGELPDGGPLLEGMKASLSSEEWDEALLLSTVSCLPTAAAGRATRSLADKGFVQRGEAGFRLHALIAEPLVASHGAAAAETLRRHGERLPVLLLGEALERCGDVAGLERVFENPGVQAFRQAPESYLRWDRLLDGPPSALRHVTVGGTLKVLGRFDEAVPRLDAALAMGGMRPNDELLALRYLCWSLASTEPARATEVVARGEELLDEVDPDSAGRFLSDASFVDMIVGRFQDADARLERALSVLPPDSQFRVGVRINLALNRWDRLGDFDGRLAAQTETLDAVWNLYPSDAPGQCRDVAMMHWWAGDHAAARAYLERALEASRSNPLIGLEAAAGLAALDGDPRPFPELMERAAIWEDDYTLDVVAMHALGTLPATATMAQARGYFAAVPAPVLAAAPFALFLDRSGDASAALEVLDAVISADLERPYLLYLRAARYRITRDQDDLEAFIALTTAGPRLLPGLVPLSELPADRPELARHYPVAVVAASGWSEAIALRTAEMPELRLTLLGEFRLRQAGRDVELTDRQKQIVTLFAMGRTREAAAEAMWPETEAPARRNNMGVHLSFLRKVLEPWGALTYVLEDGLRNVRTDLEKLGAALERGDADEVMELYREPFAPGVAIGAVEDHGEWLRTEVIGCLKTAAARQPQHGVRLLSRVLELDPLDEEALRRLLVGLIEAGRAGDARRRYLEFKDRLGEELGLEPLAETSAAIAL